MHPPTFGRRVLLHLSSHGNQRSLHPPPPAGVFSGYLDHFLLWQLEELGARMWLLSFSIAVAALASLPFAVLAEPFVRKLGSGRLVAVGLVVVGVKLFGKTESG